jgi:hypothetical protein
VLEMPQANVLNRVQIASPCQASWAEMSGDDRARFCDLCSLHVYNISEMSTAEATALIKETEGTICVRLYRRRDGTVLTADCPVGAHALALRARKLRQLVAGAVLGLAGVFTGSAYVRAFAELDSSDSVSQPTAGPMVTPRDWYQWMLVKFGIRKLSPPVSPCMQELEFSSRRRASSIRNYPPSNFLPSGYVTMGRVRRHTPPPPLNAPDPPAPSDAPEQ